MAGLLKPARSLQAGILACLGIAIPTILGATEPGSHTRRKIALPSHGALVITSPSAWRVSATRPSEDALPIIELSPESGESFSVQIKVSWPGDPKLLEPYQVRDAVEAARGKAGGSTPESEIRELHGDNLSGYYFSAVEKHPKRGEWPYMTQGAAILQDLLLSFTILSNDSAQPEVLETLEMLRSATKLAETTQSRRAPQEANHYDSIPTFSHDKDDRCPEGQSFLVDECVDTPKIVKRTLPKYPPLAQRAKVQGTVELMAVLLPDGKVGDVRVTKGPGNPKLGFEDAAIEAVKQWQYTPVILHGKPTAVWFEAKVNFFLSN